MNRRVLLVDDEIAVLLTLKAVLEINGFDVDTAASAREGRLKVRNHEYHMIITDMKMESDKAGAEVVAAARNASYRPAVALLTAFPVAEEDWQEMGADHMLVKPMHTRILLEQIDRLFETHTRKLAQSQAASPATEKVAPKRKKPASKALAAKKPIKSAKPAVAARKPRVTRKTAGARSK
jgi:DNA-binding response OmpR family regulator